MRERAVSDGLIGLDARPGRIDTGRTGLIVDTCRATRLLVPGFLVGIGVSSVAGNDLLGWIAAAAVVAVLLVVQRVRGTATACAIRVTDEPTHDAAASNEPAPTPTSPK